MSKDGVMLKRFWQVEGWLYGGDIDVDVSHRTAKVVRIRYPQVCCSGYHDGTVPAGTAMIAERALVDGKWVTCYTCKDCIDKSVKELK